MFGFPHFGYFGRFSDKLSPWRRTVRSSFKRPFTGRTAVFTCNMTGEVISPLDCRECNHYTLIEGEEDLRTCHYRSPEQLEVEQENRRKTEEEIRRNEQLARESDEEMSRLEDRRRSITEEFEKMHEREIGEKEEIEMLWREKTERENRQMSEEDHQEDHHSIEEEGRRDLQEEEHDLYRVNGKRYKDYKRDEGWDEEKDMDVDGDQEDEEEDQY